MKKLVSLFLAIALCAACVSALAAGEVTVSQKQFYTVVTDYSQYGYLFAKIENTGDEPIMLDYGKVVTFDESDDIMDTSNYISAYPRYLQPGEYAYLYDISYGSLGDPIVADYKFSIGTTDQERTVLRLDSESAFDPGEADSKYDDLMFATFTNTTDGLLSNLYIVYALLDEEGNILYLNYDYLDDIALHPGSTITVARRVDSDIVDYLKQNSITPATVDTLVYVEQ